MARKVGDIYAEMEVRDGGTRRDVDRIMAKAAARAQRHLDRVNATARRLERQLRTTGQRGNWFGRAMEGAAKRVQRSWARMDSTVRLVLTLLLVSMGQIAALGSAVGGSLAVVGSLLLALGAGAGVAIVGFQGLFSETARLTRGAQAARDAFRGLGGAIAGLRDGITNSMFDRMAPSIERLTARIPELQGVLNDLATSVGDAISGVLDKISSDAGIAGIQRAIEPLGGIFESLFHAAHDFGAGLINVFTEAAPLAQRFADAVGRVGERFLEWTLSDAGRERIQRWLETAERIMPPLGELIAETGRALARLVTPETVGQLEGLIKSLRDFMPVLGEILGVISHLNILGVVAEALNLIGDAIQPLLPGLHDLGGLIGDLLIGAMELLAPLLGKVADAFAPILERIVEMAERVLPPLLDALEPVIEIIGDLFVAALEALAPHIDTIAELFETLAPLLEPILEAFGELLEPLMALIDPLIDLAMTAVMPLIEALILLLPPILDVVSIILESLLPVIEGMMDDFQGVIDFLTGIFTGDWELAWSGVETLFLNTWDRMTSGFTFWWDVITGAIDTGLQFVKDTWETHWNQVSETFGGIWEGLVNALAGFVSQIVAGVKDLGGKVRSAWERAWNTVRDFFKRIWDGIVSAAEGFFSKVRSKFTEVTNFVRDIPDKILGALGDLGNLLSSSGRSLVDGFLGGIQSAWNRLTGWVSGAMDNLRGLWPFSPAKWGPFSGRGWVSYSGEALGEEFGESTRKALLDQQGKLRGAMSRLSETFTDLTPTSNGSEAFNAGEMIARSIADGMLSQQTHLVRVANSLSTSISRAFTSPTVTPGLSSSTLSRAGGPPSMSFAGPIGMTSGEGGGSDQSRRIIFEPGAIVVRGADDPARAALEVVDRIVERVS